jgi:hypothetical protein
MRISSSSLVPNSSFNLELGLYPGQNLQTVPVDRKGIMRPPGSAVGVPPGLFATTTVIIVDLRLGYMGHSHTCASSSAEGGCFEFTTWHRRSVDRKSNNFCARSSDHDFQDSNTNTHGDHVSDANRDFVFDSFRDRNRDSDNHRVLDFGNGDPDCVYRSPI